MTKGSLKRMILALPVVFALMIAFVVPGSALAADGELNGYTTTTTTTTTTTPPTTNTTPTTPATTPTATTPTATTPATGTLPEKQSSTPTKTTAPEKTSTTPKTSTEPAAKKASTLPFTGFDLRWTVGAGVLLLLMGFSIVATQRRQRRNLGR